MPWPAPLCTHRMPDGYTCGTPAKGNTKFCFNHDPERRARKPLRKFAASIERLDSPDSIRHVLQEIMRHLLQGKIDCRRAQELIRAVENASDVYRVETKAARNPHKH